MHNLSFSAIDLLVVLTLIVSTALAIWRGFIRETLSVFAWAAAAFATLYFGPHTAGLLRERITTPLVGSLLGYAGVFLLVLIPLSFVAYRFSESVKNSPVGAVDRSLGAAFGVVRGFAVLGLGYLLYSVFVPVPDQPGWVGRARLLPAIQSSSDVLLSLVPARVAGRMAAADSNTGPGVPVPRPKPGATNHRTGKSYGAEDRHALDRLIQSTGNGGNQQ